MLILVVIYLLSSYLPVLFYPFFSGKCSSIHLLNVLYCIRTVAEECIASASPDHRNVGIFRRCQAQRDQKPREGVLGSPIIVLMVELSPFMMAGYRQSHPRCQCLFLRSREQVHLSVDQGSLSIPFIRLIILSCKSTNGHGRNHPQLLSSGHMVKRLQPREAHDSCALLSPISIIDNLNSGDQ